VGRGPGQPTPGVGVWGQHSKWTSLFPGNVLPLENVSLHWQLLSLWHSWSPPSTATIPSRSSTPKPPGRGPVSILSQNHQPLPGDERTVARKAAQMRTAAGSTVVLHGVRMAGRSELETRSHLFLLRK
jgi:hypothetical protein